MGLSQSEQKTLVANTAVDTLMEQVQLLCQL